MKINGCKHTIRMEWILHPNKYRVRCRDLFPEKLMDILWNSLMCILLLPYSVFGKHGNVIQCSLYWLSMCVSGVVTFQIHFQLFCFRWPWLSLGSVYNAFCSTSGCVYRYWNGNSDAFTRNINESATVRRENRLPPRKQKFHLMY